MASPLVVLGSFALVVVVLLSILGAVDRRERSAFVLGILVFMAVHAVPATPDLAATAIAVVGLGVAVAVTVPLLRESV